MEEPEPRMLALNQMEVSMSFITKFIKNESGATAIEYGLIAAFIAVALILVLPKVRDGMNKNFTNIATELNNAGTGGKK